MKLHELENIPIKNREYNPNTEQQYNDDKFYPSDYTIKHGKIHASSDEELDTFVEKFEKDYIDRMGIIYKYETEGTDKVANVAFYDTTTSNLDSKNKNILQAKIDAWAKENSKDEKQVISNKSKDRRSNIEKALATLSDKSLDDLEKYINVLKTRDKYDR